MTPEEVVMHAATLRSLRTGVDSLKSLLSAEASEIKTKKPREPKKNNKAAMAMEMLWGKKK